MTSFGTLEKLAMSFPEVTVEAHFEKISFRINRKIFLTYDEKNHRATVKLSEANQGAFSALDNTIYPVDNKWGKQGWTSIELENVPGGLLIDVIAVAYCEVAPKKLADRARANKNSNLEK